MMKSYTWSICAALLMLVSCGAPAENKSEETPGAKADAKNAESIALEDGKYQIDTENSIVNWRGTEITGKFHVGTASVYKGTIKVTDQRFEAKLAVDMQSIQCTDENMREGAKENLVGHLKSDDFFGVEAYPYARLVIADGKMDESKAYANGKITVRDVTRPIEFPLNLRMENGKLIGDAQLTFNRADHNVKFRSGAFPDLFPDLGDKLINDEIELDVHIEAMK